MTKPATAIAVVLLAFIALGHLIRVLAGWELVIGTVVVPMWPSVIAFLVFGGIAILLWREARRAMVRDIIEAVQQLKQQE